MPIVIEELKKADETIVEDIIKLLKQLREDPKEHVASLADLVYILDSKDAHIIVVQVEGRIVGIGTLYVLQKLGKRTGVIEDVVVDEGQRGKGLGEQLVRKIIEVARENGVKSLSLTSRPERIAANKLYQKIGFDDAQ